MYYSLWEYTVLSQCFCSVKAPVCQRCRCSCSGADNPTQTGEVRSSTDYVGQGLFSSLVGSSLCCHLGKIPASRVVQATSFLALLSTWPAVMFYKPHVSSEWPMSKGLQPLLSLQCR